jgi:hypothetical protein
MMGVEMTAMSSRTNAANSKIVSGVAGLNMAGYYLEVRKVATVVDASVVKTRRLGELWIAPFLEREQSMGAKRESVCISLLFNRGGPLSGLTGVVALMSVGGIKMGGCSVASSRTHYSSRDMSSSSSSCLSYPALAFGFRCCCYYCCPVVEMMDKTGG